MKQWNNKIIHSKLTTHEFDFSEEAWEKMENLLDSSKVARQSLITKIITTMLVFTILTIVKILLFEPITQVSDTSTALLLEKQASDASKASDALLDTLIPKNNPPFDSLQQQLQTFNHHYAPEKVYVHTDRTLYKSGEAIWFAVYVRDAFTLQPSAKSDIVYVEWLSPKGSIEKKLTLLVENGVARGDIQLSQNVKGGRYKIKAYTNWQRNFLPPNSLPPSPLKGEEGEQIAQNANTSQTPPSGGWGAEKDITIQKIVLPNLRMKLDFEREAYGAGDKVVANLELNNLENAPLAVKTFTYKVQLEGKTILEKTAQTDVKGKADVEFQLPNSLKSNDGLLNVLVEHNGQTESISRSIPIILNKIDLQFMAEGGVFLENAKNTVAFKAINEFGKAADVEGVIFDNRGNQMTTFKSYHMGMGSVQLLPNKGETYFAKITKPRGISQKYPLPQPETQGVVLHLHQQKKNKIQLSTTSSTTEPLFVVLKAHGKIYDTKALPRAKSHQFQLSPKDIPAGIATITVLDAQQRPRAERLVFVHPDKRLNIDIQTDKEKYQPREKVTASIKVTDHNGKPVKGSFSLAAIDDKLRTFADDKQANIVSALLLSSELKGKVEEPNFYLPLPLERRGGNSSQKEGQRAVALDLLMLTQGWRKVSWVETMQQPLAEMKYKPEKAYIEGYVLDKNNQPLEGVDVEIWSTNISVKTDKKGYFAFNNILQENQAATLKVRINDVDIYKNIDDVGQYIAIKIPDLEPKIYYIDCISCKTIRGKVIDVYTKEGLIVAHVHDEKPTFVTSTDIDGSFELKNLQFNHLKDSVTLIFSYYDYQDKEVTIPLLENKEIVIEVPLIKGIELAQEVVITSYVVPLIAQDHTTTGKAINPSENTFSGIVPNPRNIINLEYSGHEDEILKKIEAGNVSLPLRSELIKENEGLLGTKTQLQFGKLTVTNMMSQQRSRRQEIIINENGEETSNYELNANQVLKIIEPAKYETVTERIMVKAPNTRIEVIPAEYETVTETVLAKAESKKLVTVPAEYETVTETVEVSPATTRWVKRKADRNCLSADPDDCQVWVLVEVPARYENIIKTVLKTPSTTKEVTVPAEYQQVTKRVVKTPATTRTVEVPAEYKTITKKVLVTPAVKQIVNVIKGYENAPQSVINEYKKALNFKAGYYPVREFYHPKYENQDTIDQRNDFRSTAFWQPIVQTNDKGEAQVSFYNSDDLTTFKIIVEGIGENGQVGQGEATYYSQLPFGMLMKAPPVVLTGDEIRLPLTLMNNTNQQLSGKLDIKTPASFIAAFKNIKNITLAPNEKRTIHLAYQVKKAVDGVLEVKFEADGVKDAFRQEIKVLERGFPVREVFSNKALEKTHQFIIQAPIEGTLTANLNIYPDAAADMLESAKRMLRQPSGCFEQVSSSNYPNLLVLDYLYEIESSDPQIEAQAQQYLEIGYKKLVSYENTGGGFDWFGRGPAHEGLTAYGLMEFVDMSYVYPVEQALIDRTAEWLLSRRDGKGSWKYHTKNLHSWKVGNQISDAYIVWAVCEAGFGDKIPNEIEKSYQDAIKTQDPYLMALVANAFYKLNDNRAVSLVEQLLELQNENGSWNGKTHSITYSKGNVLTIETTALAVLAAMKVNEWAEGQANFNHIQKAINFLMASKSSYGFGSTQSTVLAMKAIIQFAKMNKNTPKNDGIATIYVNGTKRFEKYIAIQNTSPTTIEGIEAFLKTGKNSIKVVLNGMKTPLAHDISIKYATTSPISNDKATVHLSTILNQKKVKVGNTVRLTTTIQNKTNELILNPIAIIGIPSGASLQPWQLKELQEQNAFDYYELMDGYIVFHFVTMAANEQKVIHLDLKADIPGKYEAPASSAYLYYNLDKKSWAEPLGLEIEN